MSAAAESLSSVDDVDRRRPRQRALLSARILHGAENFTLDCAVRDRSEQGVRIRLRGLDPVPASFVLILVARGSAHPARVVWRNGVEMGLALAEPLDLNSDEQRGVRRVLIDATPRYG